MACEHLTASMLPADQITLSSNVYYVATCHVRSI